MQKGHLGGWGEEQEQEQKQEQEQEHLTGRLVTTSIVLQLTLHLMS